ncbi:carbohydrate sulfotransferase 8-like [Dromiciops gliroides]|uniref:carbohydrate sulfotransferase 8-like n=1 Tax=Dromiciops gliroides TaxID=33562 RepID=UPI001CC72095|nr:carbohydrate sulfotransferase 8-like [Dromiciops gliroides]
MHPCSVDKKGRLGSGPDSLDRQETAYVTSPHLRSPQLLPHPLRAFCGYSDIIPELLKARMDQFCKLHFLFGLCLLLLWIYYRQLQTPQTGKPLIRTDTHVPWKRTQQQRLAQLSAACKRYGLWNSSSLPLPKQVARQLLVEPNHHLLYCEVPKAGCSNWRRVLLLLTLNLSGWDPADVESATLHQTRLLRRLSSFPRPEGDLVLQNYTRVLVTRHPLERLVSAYRDKLLHSEPYYIQVANRMRAAVRGAGDQQKQRNLTFPEFVTFVLRQEPAKLDVHWKPIELLCLPCTMRYDMLIRHENLSSEAGHALSFLGIPGQGLFPSIKEHLSERRTNVDLTLHYLRQLSPKQLSGLYSLYFLDFSLFGYQPLIP